ncbi:MAG: alpha/beta hydrolase, partial [Streptomycetaceae bacterium]|nr:alpha/beta hydrolase [Streptomycetaceae bacterium]
MNDIEELKRFIVVHARLQAIPRERYEAVLARVTSDEEGAEGSWTREWTRSGEELERAGKLLEAARSYHQARFPFADGPAREDALRRTVDAFDRWRATARTPIERLDIELPGGVVAAWASGLAP